MVEYSPPNRQYISTLLLQINNSTTIKNKTIYRRINSFYMQIGAVESLSQERKKSSKLSISNEAFIRFIVPGRHSRNAKAHMYFLLCSYRKRRHNKYTSAKCRFVWPTQKMYVLLLLMFCSFYI